MGIKKAYVELVDFLEANSNKKVSTVMDEVIAMTSAKSTKGGSRQSSNVLRDAEGNVAAVFCYYHKMFEPVADCAYGAKKSSSTGLNTMCKEGTSNWTKQARISKKANEALLAQLEAGEITSDDLPTLRAAIDEARSAIYPREDGIGYETVEAAAEALGLS